MAELDLREGRVHTSMEANTHIKVPGSHQRASVTQKAWSNEQTMLAPHPHPHSPSVQGIGVLSLPGLGSEALPRSGV